MAGLSAWKNPDCSGILIVREMGAAHCTGAK
jgi:hypothetical protein